MHIFIGDEDRLKQQQQSTTTTAGQDTINTTVTFWSTLPDQVSFVNDTTGSFFVTHLFGAFTNRLKIKKEGDEVDVSQAFKETIDELSKFKIKYWDKDKGVDIPVKQHPTLCHNKDTVKGLRYRVIRKRDRCQKICYYTNNHGSELATDLTDLQLQNQQRFLALCSTCFPYFDQDYHVKMTPFILGDAVKLENENKDTIKMDVEWQPHLQQQRQAHSSHKNMIQCCLIHCLIAICTWVFFCFL